MKKKTSEPTLSQYIQLWRSDRPDEWTMDTFSRMASEIENALAEVASIAYDLQLAEIDEQIRKYQGYLTKGSRWTNELEAMNTSLKVIERALTLIKDTDT